MYNAEIPVADRKAVIVQRNDDTGPGAMTCLAILGPKGGVTRRAWLDRHTAVQVAAAISKAYQAGES